MRRYVLVRSLSILPTLLGVSVAVFLMIRLIPGTIVDQMIGTEGTYSEQSMRALRAFFGLDQPIHVQYGRWLGRVLQGDLGTSWRTGLPGGRDDPEPAPGHARADARAPCWSPSPSAFRSASLSARRENTRLDHAVRLVSLFSLSIPVFWQATMLILATSLWLDWAPSVDFVSPWQEPAGEPRHHGAAEPRPRHGGRGRLHADDALDAPRGHAAGLHPDRARQGAPGAGAWCGATRSGTA